MQILQNRNRQMSLGYDRSSDTIGIVFKTQKELDGRPLLGLVIPKFMSSYTFTNGDTPSETSVNISKSKFINSSKCFGFLENSAVVKNYILVRPYLNQNQTMPNYTVGDKVIVTMIDQDIKTMAFLPYSINRLGQRATDKAMFAVPANTGENVAVTEDNSYFIKLDSEKKVCILSPKTEVNKAFI